MIEWHDQAGRRRWRAEYVEQFLQKYGLSRDSLSSSTLKCLDDWARQVQLVEAQPSVYWGKVVLNLCRAVESELAAGLGSVAGLEFLAEGIALGQNAHCLSRVTMDSFLKQRLLARGIKPGAVSALPNKLLDLAALRKVTDAAHGGAKIGGGDAEGRAEDAAFGWVYSARYNSDLGTEETVNVLIVCLGNTCRSPMAAGVLLTVARELGIPVFVRTAGLAHHPNTPVAPYAVYVMREIGVDISHDYSKPVTDADLQWADIVVCLQRSHIDHLAEEYPWAVGKVRYLGHDVSDPYKGTLEVYRAKRDELFNAFRAVAKTLLKM